MPLRAWIPCRQAIPPTLTRSSKVVQRNLGSVWAEDAKRVEPNAQIQVPIRPFLKQCDRVIEATPGQVLVETQAVRPSRKGIGNVYELPPVNRGAKRFHHRDEALKGQWNGLCFWIVPMTLMKRRRHPAHRRQVDQHARICGGRPVVRRERENLEREHGTTLLLRHIKADQRRFIQSDPKAGSRAIIHPRLYIRLWCVNQMAWALLLQRERGPTVRKSNESKARGARPRGRGRTWGFGPRS